jgi:hypothetical protein
VLDYSVTVAGISLIRKHPQAVIRLILWVQTSVSYTVVMITPTASQRLWKLVEVTMPVSVPVPEPSEVLCTSNRWLFECSYYHVAFHARIF